MNQSALTLASASPRRHALLKALGLTFDVIVTDGEERVDAVAPALLASLPAFPLPAATHPTLLAWRKAQAARETGCAGAILGADTIVVLDTTVLGKPHDPAHARAMLRQLSGREHMVYTGVALLPAAGPARLELVAARVRLAALDDAVIADYVAGGEPLDKAGSYGIQGVGGRLVESVAGSFTAVVGLPLPAVARLLTQADLTPPRSVEQAWHAWRETLTKEPLCIHQSMC